MRKRILHAIIRFFTRHTTRRVRKAIYSTPFIGGDFQKLLKKILYTLICTDDFQWFEFKSGHRSGLKMRLKLPEECEFSLETHEPDVTALLRKLIQPGFKVIDVGAHIGYFTLLISRLVGREGKVFALEPLPNNVKRLKEHLSRNNCSQNTKVLELAAADYDGEEQFLEFGFATVGRLASTGLFVSDKPRGRMTVKCRSLDSLLSEGCIESPDFVKIDVEGAELWVLKGMENLIKIHKPKLLVEMHDKKIAEDIINFLENKGYKAYYLNKDALRKLNFAQPDLVNKSILFICNCA